jgi:hypothetical protein
VIERMLLKIRDGEWIDCEGVRVYSGQVLEQDGSDQLAVELRINDQEANLAVRLIFSPQEAERLGEALAAAKRELEFSGRNVGLPSRNSIN